MQETPETERDPIAEVEASLHGIREVCLDPKEVDAALSALREVREAQDRLSHGLYALCGTHQDIYGPKRLPCPACARDAARAEIEGEHVVAEGRRADIERLEAELDELRNRLVDEHEGNSGWAEARSWESRCHDKEHEAGELLATVKALRAKLAEAEARCQKIITSSDAWRNQATRAESRLAAVERAAREAKETLECYDGTTESDYWRGRRGGSLESLRAALSRYAEAAGEMEESDEVR